MLGKVVIADKSRTVRKMVEIALAKHPFELVYAEDGQAALDAVRKHNAIALIVDAALPGVDGYEVTRQLKGDPNTRDAKVLLLVGRSSRFDSARGRQSGVDGHLTKPFITQKMVQAVFTSLGQAVPDQGLFKSSMMNIPLARKPAEATPEPAAPPAPPKAPEPPKAFEPAPPKAFEPAPPKAFEPAPPKAPASRPQARKPAPEPAAPSAPAAPPAAAVNAAVQAATAAPAGGALAGAPREVIEQIAWQVIPQLAEAILKEEIAKVVRERMGA